MAQDLNTQSKATTPNPNAGLNPSLMLTKTLRVKHDQSLQSPPSCLFLQLVLRSLHQDQLGGRRVVSEVSPPCFSGELQWS